MSEDIFAGTGDNQSQDKGQGETNVVKNDDGSFVVNGKNFENVDALINSKIHADNHINTLIGEKQKVNEKLSQVEANQDTLNSLEGQVARLLNENSNQNSAEQMLLEGNSNMQNQTATSPQLSADAIKAAVEAAVKPIQDQMQQQKEETNRAKVKATLIDKFGSADKAAEAYSNFRKVSGLSGDLLENLINTNPEGLVNLVAASTSSTPSIGTRNDGQHVGAGMPSGQRSSGDAGGGGVPAEQGFKALRKKMKTTPGQWSEADQSAMNDGFDKLGPDYFHT